MADRRLRPLFDQDHDLVVIGGGPAGNAAAQAARWSGARVALIDDGAVGVRISLTAFVLAARDGANFSAAVSAARRVDAVERRHDRLHELRRMGVEVIDGRARFIDPGELEVDGRRLRSGRFVIATGSRPADHGIAGLGNVDVLYPSDLVRLEAPPTSLAVIGGGSIGCEIAQACARAGVRVVLFEAERILSDHDPEGSAVILDALRGDGVDVRQGTRVQALEPDALSSGVKVLSDRGEAVVAERVLVASGRIPVTGGLDLPAAGVATDDAGFITVDEHLRTSARGTYAAGDVTGTWGHAHAAAEMGRLAAGHALKRGPRGAYRAQWIPRVTYTDPEIAYLGISEREARPWDRVAEVPFREVARAIAVGRTDGFCKLIARPRPPTGRLYGGRLIGATIVGPNAGELIAEVTLAMRAGMFPARLAQAAHAHLTWSVVVQTCAAQFIVEVNGRRARKPRAV